MAIISSNRSKLVLFAFSLLLLLPCCRSAKSSAVITEERRDSVEAVYSAHHFREAAQTITDSLVTREWVWQITDTSGKTTTYRKNFVGRNSVNTNHMAVDSGQLADIRVGKKTTQSVQKQQTQTVKSTADDLQGFAALALIAAALALALLIIRKLRR